MTPVPHAFLRPLLAHPVAVFGAGVSGAGVGELLAALRATSVLYDRHGGAARPDFTAAEAQRHALVIFSPGFPPAHPWLAAARAAGATCLGELDFASLFWRGRIVAVTGTNGKTTLTEFLTHALRAVGESACAAGNIGFPLSCAALHHNGERATAVCEVSSFQAETFAHFHADAALWTNFAEDHLERHDGLAAYFDAKLRLLGRTPPAGCRVGSSVTAWAGRLGRPLPDGSAVVTEGLAPDPRLAGTVFAEYPQRENFALAQAWWRLTPHAPEALYAAARTFRLGRHRLARVAEIDGVTWWNDSKATNFHAVLGALGRFDRPVVLIAGGRAKGGDIPGFVATLRGRVAHLLLLGETAAALGAAARASGIPATDCGRSLAAAVDAAARLARPGDHVLLSPAFASFDMFRSYEDRGDQFEALVRERAARPASVSISP